MKLTIINVGYGDALLFEMENGYTVLLDGGSLRDDEFSGDPCRIRAVDFLRARGVTHLDAMFISHIHDDHVCGLTPILREIPADRLYIPYPIEVFERGRAVEPGPEPPRSVPMYTDALNEFRQILQSAKERGVPVRTLHPGDVLPLTEECTVSVLAPKPSAIATCVKRLERLWETDDPQERTHLLTLLDRDSNNTSLLLRFDCDQTAILAAADNVPAHWDEVPISSLQNVNVLKLPHHGQLDAVDEAFMRDMPLEYVITTAASDRRYGSANAENYRRLTAMRPEGQAPKFLFSDERSYEPWFGPCEPFQAITLVINSGAIHPEFVRIHSEKERIP
ncbi:MAG: hypothetical protein IJ074_04390 [Clostridia bacterium]|nr:hypothetical protein [Clostridia bacterium]